MLLSFKNKLYKFLLFNKNKGYKLIDSSDKNLLRQKYADIWKSSSIPTQQLKTTRKQVAQWRNIDHMKVLVDLVSETGLSNPRLLEIGCSTGYFYEIFSLSHTQVSYSGCDYSNEFISEARRLYPAGNFQVCDAVNLNYVDKSFDIAVSGCCILHIVDYEKAIEEAARVAAQYVIFQRTPVIHVRDTTFTEKIAYGLPMVEIFFNEEELFQLFKKNNLSVVAVKSFGKMNVPGIAEEIYTKSYLCQKF